MPEPVSAKPVPKLRAKSASKPPGRPRPKTIHVDQDADVNAALGSRGPRGSISNISGEIDHFTRIACVTFCFSFFGLHPFFFLFLHPFQKSGGMTRSDSRNSINDDHRGRSGGLSLASMGTGRHSAMRAQTPSRRGSSVYIGGDDSGL